MNALRSQLAAQASLQEEVSYLRAFLEQLAMHHQVGGHPSCWGWAGLGCWLLCCLWQYTGAQAAGAHAKAQRSLLQTCAAHARPPR
jgi:hypothetical protein